MTSPDESTVEPSEGPLTTPATLVVDGEEWRVSSGCHYENGDIFYGARVTHNPGEDSREVFWLVPEINNFGKFDQKVFFTSDDKWQSRVLKSRRPFLRHTTEDLAEKRMTESLSRIPLPVREKLLEVLREIGKNGI